MQVLLDGNAAVEYWNQVGIRDVVQDVPGHWPVDAAEDHVAVKGSPVGFPLLNRSGDCRYPYVAGSGVLLHSLFRQMDLFFPYVV